MNAWVPNPPPPPPPQKKKLLRILRKKSRAEAFANDFNFSRILYWIDPSILRFLFLVG